MQFCRIPRGNPRFQPTVQWTPAFEAVGYQQLRDLRRGRSKGRASGNMRIDRQINAPPVKSQQVGAGVSLGYVHKPRP
jgi:hypothetical protein